MKFKTFTRFLLLTATLFQLGSFVGNDVAHAKSNRERVIAEIARLGGKIEFDELLPGKPIVLIDLHGTAVTNADLAILKGLRDLRFLDLRLTKITDEGVAKLKNLTGLQTLNLFRTQLSDKGLAQLRKLTLLQTLLIGGTQITDAGLTYLKSFTNLRKLSLFQTKVSDAGIASLKALIKLETLLIGGTNITPAGVAELQRTLPRLRFSESTTGVASLRDLRPATLFCSA